MVTFLASLLWWQVPAPLPVAARAVTLEEALAKADALPDLQAAMAALRAAEAGVRLAGRPGDPTVAFSRRSITAHESFTLSLPLPWPGRGARVSAATAEAVAVGADLDAAKNLARRAMRLLWFGLAAREDLASAAADRAGRLNGVADAVKELHDAGRVSLLELSRARADAALAAADTVQASEEARTAEAGLRRWMALPSTERVTVARPLPPFEAEGPIETALETAAARSPLARSAEARFKAAEARLRLASALRFPGVAVEAGADRNDPTQPGTDKSIGVSLTVPLGAGPGIAIAKAERDGARALLDSAKREALDATETAWRAAHAARARYQAIETEALPSAIQAAELTQIAYREGRSDIFRLLDAERALAEARSALAEAYLAWGTARAGLLSIIGEER